MIVAAFSGVGKSHFASLYPDVAIDFVCMPYKYILDTTAPHGEWSKADPNLVMRPEWPLNYVEAIKKLPSNKIILIPSDCRVLGHLASEGIPYFLCYPQKKAKKTYLKRYIKRDNSQNFISIFIGDWKWFMKSLREDTFGKHIVMKPKQYLSDVLNIKAILKGKKRVKYVDTSIR